MRLQPYGQYSDTFPNMMISPQQFTERKLSCDSRYRSIVGQLDVMIELVSGEPGRNLTLELEHLLDAMMDHIDSENSYMEVVGFPQAVQHHLHHQFICINTAELCHRFSKGQDVLLEELAYIRLLWMEHIHVHDRAFEEYLAS
jgi:hemerythrin